MQDFLITFTITFAASAFVTFSVCECSKPRGREIPLAIGAFVAGLLFLSLLI